MKTSRSSAKAMMADMGDSMTRQMDLAAQLADGFVDIGRRLLDGLGSGLPRTAGCCDIPEPCWMPADLGELHCALCAGGRGTLHLTVTNTDFRRRDFQVAAAGPDAGRVQIAPGSFQLGPKERRRVKVTFNADLDDGVDCDTLEALIWVIGCRAHYLRWTIEVGKRDTGCCHEVEVFDQPDYVHHWYDHFYCYRDCFGRVIRPEPQKPRPEG
jgi:hypothetical protein